MRMDKWYQRCLKIDNSNGDILSMLTTLPMMERHWGGRVGDEAETPCAPRPSHRASSPIVHFSRREKTVLDGRQGRQMFPCPISQSLSRTGSAQRTSFRDVIQLDPRTHSTQPPRKPRTGRRLLPQTSLRLSTREPMCGIRLKQVCRSGPVYTESLSCSQGPCSL